jgi:HSP20 family protein
VKEDLSSHYGILFLFFPNGTYFAFAMAKAIINIKKRRFIMTIIRKYNSMLPDYLERFFGRDYNELTHEFQTNRPAVNVVENNDDFVLEVAAPGYDKKNFSINVDNNQLTISASRDTNQNENYALREFHTHGFERVFDLSKSIDTEKINASYRDGILYVTLPKREEAKVKPPKMIEIK